MNVFLCIVYVGLYRERQVQVSSNKKGVSLWEGETLVIGWKIPIMEKYLLKLIKNIHFNSIFDQNKL